MSNKAIYQYFLILSMRPSDVGEVVKNIVDGEIQRNLWSRVTPLDEVLYTLVLSDELFLHGPPNNLKIPIKNPLFSISDV